MVFTWVSKFSRGRKNSRLHTWEIYQMQSYEHLPHISLKMAVNMRCLLLLESSFCCFFVMLYKSQEILSWRINKSLYILMFKMLYKVNFFLNPCFFRIIPIKRNQSLWVWTDSFTNFWRSSIFRSGYFNNQLSDSQIQTSSNDLEIIFSPYNSIVLL